ncbi:hypothetical protein C5D07_04255 [Rathayibacter tritici]|uniref:condensation domain-containing protein n=2 Tax=Rathayibacter tritici TaxID=33888 RepID=UPI000CE7D883|nr:condensation domain-containing protein [Rathayibacter tritici]PPF30571.1 hypothetical protein C5C06_04860 [Rathayibacter tritici]PPI17869.1 hypothetical protein C5D07_04255 [Rathayibacter tritici]
MNAHGKVDRAALLRLLDAPPAQQMYIGPSDPADHRLRGVVQEVLGDTTVAPDASFIASGGNSLHAVRVVSRMQERFGTAPRIRDLLGPATLRELDDALASGSASTRADLPLLAPIDGAGDHPASLHQERMWFQTALYPGASVAYNETSAGLVDGPLDVEALEAAVNRVAERHEALRSGLHLVGDALLVRVEDEPALRIRRADVSTEPDPRAAAQRMADDLAREPFAVDVAPLVRGLVVSLADEQHLVVWTMHHLIADQLSFAVFERELATSYGIELGEDVQHHSQARPLQPRDHSRWQRAVAAGVATSAALERRRAELDGAPTTLDWGRERVGRFAFQGVRGATRSSTHLRRSVTQLATRALVTPYTVCLSAYAILLSGRTKSCDLLVGTPIAGRTTPAAESALGYFANTVVVRIRLREDEPFRSLLERTNLVVLEALEHQHVGFNDVVRAVNPSGQPVPGQPLVQAVLAFQGDIRPAPELLGTTSRTVLVDNGSARVDLALEIFEDADEYQLLAIANAQLFARPDVDAALQDYLFVLGRALAEPDAEIGATIAALIDRLGGDAS